MTEAEDPQLSRLRGLLVRDFAKNTTRRYAHAEPAMEAVELLPGKEHAVRLANVTCANAGLYSCFLAAPVREQNREGRVRLIVTGESGVEWNKKNISFIIIMIVKTSGCIVDI